MTATLRRTAPFLLTPKADEPARLMLDTVQLAPGRAPEPAFLSRITQSLDLQTIAPLFLAEATIEIIQDQYETCLDYIFSHPIWAEFRSGEGHNTILAYLLETRHYLHAAMSRMAPGPASGWHDDATTLTLAQHVVEEADHAQYFEAALELLGCAHETVQRCRPSPLTMEWIYLMRAVAWRSPLIAGLCSGLLESSAKNSGVVRGWHAMLIEKDILPEPVVKAFLQHVEVDMALGHGAIWKEIVQQHSPLTAVDLRDGLNATCTVAEMLYRSFDMLHDGLGANVVRLMPGLRVKEHFGVLANVDFPFNAIPVWPAEILHQVTYGAHQPRGARDVIGLAYHFDNRVVAEAGDHANVVDHAATLCQRHAVSCTFVTSGEELERLLRSWLRTIDGHRLWIEMTERPTFALMYGWVLENYFYLSAAARHVSAAIASCPDSIICNELLAHLREEMDHGLIMREGLEAAGGPLPVRACRPLPTTVAFLGYLRELASMDWKAFCLATAYLQFTFTPGDTRHDSFYQVISERCPSALALIKAMRRHDTVDQDLSHEGSSQRLVSQVYGRHGVDATTIARVALVPQMAWSFLDGIRTHYQQGNVALAQRLSWLADGSTGV